MEMSSFLKIEVSKIAFLIGGFSRCPFSVLMIFKHAGAASKQINQRPDQELELFSISSRNLWSDFFRISFRDSIIKVSLFVVWRRKKGLGSWVTSKKLIDRVGPLQASGKAMTLRCFVYYVRLVAFGWISLLQVHI